MLRYEKEDKLNPVDVKNLSKIEKLIAIEAQDIEIERIISSSKYARLYRITKFNSARLSPIVKRKILNTTRSIAEIQVRLSNEKSKSMVSEIFNSTFYDIQRVLTRKTISSLIDREIFKYKQEPSKYIFKKKYSHHKQRNLV